MLSRRGFLGLLAGAAAGATLDPERLLWVPGKRLISIPQRKLKKLIRVPVYNQPGGSYRVGNYDGGDLGRGSYASMTYDIREVDADYKCDPAWVILPYHRMDVSSERYAHA